jgi:hypothetical protein
MFFRFREWLQPNTIQYRQIIPWTQNEETSVATGTFCPRGIQTAILC